MPKSFLFPGGTCSKSLVRKYKWHIRYFDLGDTSYIGAVRAWLLWKRYGRKFA